MQWALELYSQGVRCLASYSLNFSMAVSENEGLRFHIDYRICFILGSNI